MKHIWYSIPCTRHQLNLDIVLACGQSFRWVKSIEGEWLGMIRNTPYRLKQTSSEILFSVVEPYFCMDNSEISTSEKVQVKKEERDKNELMSDEAAERPILEHTVKSEYDQQSELNAGTKVLDNEMIEHHKIQINSYFQLDIDLVSLYQKWNEADVNFRHICTSFQGVRMLRQDPVENLFSFICSQNNNIPRITSLVEKLCVTFGNKVSQIGEHKFYSFPEISSLAKKNVEKKLRELGFGYRAKFINQSAYHILKYHNKDWLYQLREVNYQEAHKALCELPGVGAKVADCVCLMSLDKTEAVPVDTHVWQIACKAYLPHLKKYKSITDKVYNEIGDHFRSLFGNYAGWTHAVLFSADLKKFKDLQDLQVNEMVKPAKVSKKDQVNEATTTIRTGKSRKKPRQR